MAILEWSGQQLTHLVLVIAEAFLVKAEVAVWGVVEGIAFIFSATFWGLCLLPVGAEIQGQGWVL